MYLRTLYLRQFRCYQEATFDFCPGINVIYGANAQGKTTLLEAIYLLTTGHSFRAAQIGDLLRSGTSNFYVEALFEKQGVSQTLKMSYDGKERKIFYNNTVCPSSSGLLGLLQGVVITPDDISLIKGGPVTRRQYLDLQLAQSDPLYVHHLMRYNRAMRQRNALLRNKQSASLESWENEMAHSAAYLVQKRRIAAADLQTLGQERYQSISSEPDLLALKYKSPAPSGDSLLTLKDYYIMLFQKLRHRELIVGWTLAGPHKDDLTIAIGEKEARFFASEGQQRTCVAALRLAEWERLNLLADESPLILIDDLGISLDSNRRDQLLKRLQHLGQVFLTTTENLPSLLHPQGQRLLLINQN